MRVIGADLILFSAQQDKIFAALESSNSGSPTQNNRKNQVHFIQKRIQRCHVITNHWQVVWGAKPRPLNNLCVGNLR